MPRDLIFGNGRMLVNLDKHLNIRDLYYPFIGQMNHVGGHRCRVGVWTADVGFSWIGDDWQRDLAYEAGSMLSDCCAKNGRLGLSIGLQHGISPDDNVFFERLTIVNHWRSVRSIRVFFAFDLRIDESDIGDTAFFHPFTGSMIHYKRDRFILASGQVVEDAGADGPRGIARYACDIKEFGGAEGTWRDAEDGLLSGNAIAQGSVDSVIGFDIALPSEGRAHLDMWIAAGNCLGEVTDIHKRVAESGVGPIADRARAVERERAPCEVAGLDDLPERVSSLFRRSILLMTAQIDSRGAIVASTDSDIMRTARAHYAYVWPRDGALTACALDRLGMRSITSPFFRFCKEALDRSPLRLETKCGPVAALMHKYCPDGTLGASWHPWTIDPAVAEVPIQEDGTALVALAAARHAEADPESETSRELYRTIVLPIARFLIEFRCPKTHLPLPSWDIWEERRGVHLFTTSCVIAALDAASEMARRYGERDESSEFQLAASEMRLALEETFWDTEKERFVRSVSFDDMSGSCVKDFTIDSSMYAVFAFGVLPADHPKTAATMGAIGRSLWVKVGIGGLARYFDDHYFRVLGGGDTNDIPGNPWIICTLWLADWMIATAHTRVELESALDLMEWAAVCALPTGVLPEQINPVTYEPLSVAPLTWSHAQFVTTVLNYLEREAILL